jgi:hypothetical protein
MWLQEFANEIASSPSTVKQQAEENIPRPKVAGGNLDEEMKLLGSRLSKLEQAPIGMYGDGQQSDGNIVIANSGYGSPPSTSTRQPQWPYQQRGGPSYGKTNDPYGKTGDQCGFCRSYDHLATNCEFYSDATQRVNTEALARIEPNKAENILHHMFSDGVLQTMRDAKDAQERIRKEVMDKRAAFLADRQPGTGGKLTNPPTTSKTVTFGKGGDKSDGGTGTK